MQPQDPTIYQGTSIVAPLGQCYEIDPGPPGAKLKLAVFNLRYNVQPFADAVRLGLSNVPLSIPPQSSVGGFPDVKQMYFKIPAAVVDYAISAVLRAPGIHGH